MKAESAARSLRRRKAAAKAEMEEAATKATSGGAALQALLKEAAIDVRDLEPDKQHAVPLKWTDQKLAQGVSLNAARTASSTKRGAQLCDTDHRRQARHDLDHCPRPRVGHGGYNHRRKSAETSSLIGKKGSPRHGTRSLLRCGDGAVSSARLFVCAAPTQVGRQAYAHPRHADPADDCRAHGQVTGERALVARARGLPAELTVAVGFGTGGAVPQQRVRVVGCTCEKPGLQLNGKRVKDCGMTRTCRDSRTSSRPEGGGRVDRGRGGQGCKCHGRRLDERPERNKRARAKQADMHASSDGGGGITWRKPLAGNLDEPRFRFVRCYAAAAGFERLRPCTWV